MILYNHQDVAVYVFRLELKTNILLNKYLKTIVVTQFKIK